MGINLGTAAMAFGSGLIKGDEKARKEKMLVHGEKLAAKRDAIIAMKKSKYEYDMNKYDANKTKMDSLNAVSSDLDSGKFNYKKGSANYVEGQNTVDTFSLGEAFLEAKHGMEWVANKKKSKLGAESDPTAWIAYVQSVGNNPNIKNELKNVDFKSRELIEGNYLESIQKIEDKYASQLENARHDSPLVNAILGKKKQEIDNLNIDVEQDTKDAKTIEKATTYITEKADDETITDTDVVEKITGDKELTYTDSATTIFIPKSYKDDFAAKIEKAKDVNYSDKRYNKQIADTVLTLIPDAVTKDFFEVTKDGLIAKESIINADVTIQALVSNSLEDLNVTDTFKSTGNNKSKIDFNANKRFNLAKNHVEEYGSWMADGKVLSGGSLANIWKKTSTALVVPSNSIININNNNLKGYDAVIPQDLRTDVGKVYRKFIVDKATERMNDETKGGGTLEYNINVLQRALENDNDGNNQLTQDARDYIAEALTKSGYKINKIGAEVETEKVEIESTTEGSPKILAEEKIKEEEITKPESFEDKLYNIEMVSNKPGHKSAVIYLPTQEVPTGQRVDIGTLDKALRTLKVAKKHKMNYTTIKKLEAHVASLRRDIYKQYEERNPPKGIMEMSKGQ